MTGKKQIIILTIMIILLANVALGYAGMGADDAISSAPKSVYRVWVDDYYGFYQVRNIEPGNITFKYVNNTLNINAGDSVIWENQAYNNNELTIISEQSLWDSSNVLRKNQSFSYTFTQLGTYEIYIKEEPRIRHLKIIVGSGGETPTPTPTLNPLSPDIFQPEPGKVKIVEFLKFDCSHCYDLHREMPQILENYGDRVEIIYVPISFEGQSIKSIEAYLIAKEMGKDKEMRDALFKAKFESNRDVMGSMLVLKEVAASIGLEPDFNSKLESGYAEKAALKNNAYAGMYNIQGTPTVLINGKEVKVPDIDTEISLILTPTFTPTPTIQMPDVKRRAQLQVTYEVGSFKK